MPEVQAKRERIQFPLRALFVFTVAAGLLAALTRWLIRIENAAPLLFATSIGFAVGFAIMVILQNVQITRLLECLLLVFAICGLWFSGGLIGYGCGVFIGAVVAFKGLSILNGLFHFCGLTVSIDRRPSSNMD
jgi:fatty-acid desaturase